MPGSDLMAVTVTDDDWLGDHLSHDLKQKEI
jgi:hypothetical protein